MSERDKQNKEMVLIGKRALRNFSNFPFRKHREFCDKGERYLAINDGPGRAVVYRVTDRDAMFLRREPGFEPKEVDE